MIETKDRLQKMKDDNFNKVCDYVKAQRETTIAEISKATGFSLPTVTRIMNYGVRIGTFRLTDDDVRTGGRKARGFRINKNYALSLCLYVRNSEIFWRLLDFSGCVLEDDRLDYDNTEFVKTADELIGGLCGRYPAMKVCAVCLPCVVSDGIIVDWALNPTLDGMNIAQHIFYRYDIKVFVQNDMKILAVSALDHFAGSRSRTVCALYHEGCSYGFASVINGKIQIGKCGLAGEVGYLPVEFDKTDQVDTGAKILTSAVALLDPDCVAMYLPGDRTAAALIADSVKERIPGYAMPELFVTGELTADIFKGLMKLADNNNRIKGSE